MILSTLILAQTLVAVTVAQTAIPINNFGISVKGDVGERARVANTGEFFTVRAELSDGTFTNLTSNTPARTFYQPFTSAINKSVTRIHIQLNNKGTVSAGNATSSSNVKKAITVNLNNITLNDAIYQRNSIYLQKNQKNLSIKDQQITELKLDGDDTFQLYFSQPRPDTTGCDDSSVTNKVCFNLKGGIGTSLAGAAELVDIGYTDNLGQKVVVYRGFDLSSNFDRFILRSAPNTFISSVFIRLIDDSKVTLNGQDYLRSMTLDMNSFFINGTKADPSKLLSGDMVRSFFSNGGSPSSSATEATRFTDVISNGIMRVKGEYGFALPRTALDAPDCDVSSISNKICFRLKGSLGGAMFNQTEAVDVGYTDINGNRFLPYNNTLLTQDFGRFMLKSDAPISSWFITFKDASVLNIINGTFFNRSINLDPNSLFINNTKQDVMKLITGDAISRFFSNGGNPSTNSDDIARFRDLATSGTLRLRANYNFTVPRTALDAPGCDDSSITNKICFRLKGSLGGSIFNQSEIVNIGYTDFSGTNYVAYSKVLLTQDFSRFMIKSDVPMRGWHVNVSSTSSLNMINGTNLTRAVTFDMDSLYLNGTKFEDAYKLFTDGVFSSQWGSGIKSAYPTSVINTGIETDTFSNMMYLGLFSKSGRYGMSLPRNMIDSSACDDPVLSKTAVCFSLKGQIGREIPLDAEKVKIAYETVSGNVLTSVESITLTENWERFAVVPPSGDAISKVTLSFLNDRCCYTFNGAFYDRNILFKMDSLVWNGESYANASSGIGGWKYDAFMNEGNFTRAAAIKNRGIFAWGTDYVITKPVAQQRLSSAICDDASVQNKLCWSMRGNVGNRIPGQNELVDMFWVDKDNKTTIIAQNYPLSETNERIGIPLPSPISRLVVRFINDRVWTENNVTWDRNVLMNVTSFVLNGTPISTVSPLVDGPAFKISPLAVMAGTWAWYGEYWINFDKMINFDAVCATNNMAPDYICIELKGDQAETRPQDTELVNIGYQYVNGTEVWVYYGVPMKSTFTKIGLPMKDGKKIARVIVEFLNDAMYTENGRTIDRNVRLNLNAVYVNGTLLNNVPNRIRGPIYDKWMNDKDFGRANLVVKGVWAWNGRYFINLFDSLNGDCQADGVLCFSLKGTNNPNGDVVLLQLVNGSSNSSIGYVHLSQTYSIVGINVSNASNVVISHLNKASNSGLVTLNLASFVQDGDVYTDTTDCTDEVKVMGSLSVGLN